MRLAFNQRVPGDGPIGRGGDAGGKFQRDIARRQFRQLMVAAVAVQQEDPAKAIRHQRTQKIGKDTVVGLGVQRQSGAEDQVVIRGAEGERRRHDDGNFRRGPLRRGTRQMFDGEEIGSRRQVRAVLFGGAQRQDDCCIWRDGAKFLACHFRKKQTSWFHNLRLLRSARPGYDIPLPS